MPYNSAYTGAQVDQAVGDVLQNSETWDGKQDKLTGTQGQVVGFDSEGDAVAMPAPDTGVTTFNGRTGTVMPQAGDYSADMIEFADGETFQQKYDAGELTGPQGKQGPKGDTGPQGPEGPQGPPGEDGTPSESTTVTLLANSWASSGGRYSQTVAVSFMTTDMPVVSVDASLTGTDLDADAQVLEAWLNGPAGCNVKQNSGSLTFYAMQAPTTNIPVNVGVS